MSLERKIIDQAPPAPTPARPDPTGEAAAETTARVGGGALNTKRPDHVTVRGHEIDHLQEKTTGSWSHFYRTAGVIDPGLGSRYTIRAAESLGITLNRPPAFPAEQRHPTVNRHREWDVELKIYHAAEVSITWPSTGIVWPPYRDALGFLVPGGPPANPRPAGTTDRFMLRYDERTATWWAFLTHEAAAAPDPETPADEAVEPEEEEEEEDGLTGPGIPMPAREGTLFALHTDGYSMSEDCGRSWVRKRNGGLGAWTRFSVLESLTFMNTGGDLFLESSTGSLTRVPPPAVERVEDTFFINPDFETGDTTGWTVLPEGAAVALATVQPPQQPGSRFYLGRAANLPASTPWFASQIPPETAQGRRVDLTVDVYRGAGATAEVVLTADGLLLTDGAPFPLVAAGGADGVGRRWRGDTMLRYAGETGFLEAEVLATGGGANPSFSGPYPSLFFSMGNGSTMRTSDLLFRRGITDRPLVLQIDNLIAPAGLSEFVTILTPGVEGFVYPGTSLIVSPDGLTFSGTLPSEPGTREAASVTIVVPEGVSEFSIRYGAPSGNIFFYTNGGVPPGVPSRTTYRAAPSADGVWETLTFKDVYFPTLDDGFPLITFQGTGDAWFDNLRVSRSSTIAPRWTALTRDLTARRHVALCEGSLAFIPEPAAVDPSSLAPPPAPETKFQTIPAEITGTVLEARSQLILVGSETHIHRSGDGGRSWLSIDAPTQVSQIIVGPTTKRDIPPAVEALIEGLSGMTQVTNTILQVTGNDDLQVPTGPAIITPPAPEVVAVMLVNGSLMSLDPGMVLTLRRVFSTGAHLSWDERRQKWLVVENDGKVWLGQTLADWTEAGADASTSTPPVLPGSGDLRLLPCDIGRWIGWRAGQDDMAYTDDDSEGFFASKSMASPVRAMVEKK